MAPDGPDGGEHEGPRGGRSGGFAPGLAFLIATIVAAGFIVHGYSEMHSGGCDGGTCVIALVVGVVRGSVAWVITFPVVWIVAALVLARTQRR
jgi:hypothetical protein